MLFEIEEQLNLKIRFPKFISRELAPYDIFTPSLLLANS